jgi:hypothetical protein
MARRSPRSGGKTTRRTPVPQTQREGYQPDEQRDEHGHDRDSERIEDNALPRIPEELAA